PDPRVAPRRERHDTRRDRPLAGAAGAWHGEAEPAGAPGGAATDGVGGGWRHGRLGHRRRPRISVRRMTMEWSRYRKAAVAAATAVVEIVALWQDAPQWALAAAALAGAVLVYAVPNRLAEERRRWLAATRVGCAAGGRCGWSCSGWGSWCRRRWRWWPPGMVARCLRCRGSGWGSRRTAPVARWAWWC